MKMNLLKPDKFKYGFLKAFVLFNLLTASLISCSQNIDLVINGSSAYKIVVSKTNQKDVAAAKLLSSFMAQMGGAQIPVVGDDQPVQDKEILIGNNKHAKDFNIKANGNICLIRTKGNTLLLYGNNDDHSSADCVFYFAEKYLGCKVLASDVSIIPHQKTIEIAALNDSYSSPFSYRDLYYKDTYDSTYTAFNRVNHFDAGGQDRKWGEIWSSSFMYVIPKKRYFSTHPEYFALDENGKRIPYQLDLTNEALFKQYVANFRRLMQRFPKSKVWSVAANDAAAPNYCKCDKCEAINKREGTPMGTLLNFVNRIAAQFPDKIITTQAYLYYEEPPKTLKPASNVLIVEAGSYLLNHAEPYETSKDPKTITYRRRLERWTEITKNVRVWDYVTDFTNSMCPFPNLEVQQKNLQYFAKLGIKDVFMQGNIAKGGEFAELRAYLLAKLAWNPQDNPENIMNEFLDNYYGKAGPYIKQYLSLTNTALLKSQIPLTVHDKVSSHITGFLSPDLLLQYNQIFDNAEKAVAGNPQQLEHVKVARLPLIFSILEASKIQELNGKVNTFALTKNGMGKNIQSLLTDFVQTCKRNNIVKLSEGALTVDSYYANFNKGDKK